VSASGEEASDGDENKKSSGQEVKSADKARKKRTLLWLGRTRQDKADETSYCVTTDKKKREIGELWVTTPYDDIRRPTRMMSIPGSPHSFFPPFST